MVKLKFLPVFLTGRHSGYITRAGQPGVLLFRRGKSSSSVVKRTQQCRSVQLPQTAAIHLLIILSFSASVPACSTSMTVRAACSSGGLEPGPVLPALCNLHMSLLHLLSGITFFQGEIQPDQPKCDGNVPGSSTGMLRFVGIDNVLVNKRSILLCNRITLEVGVCLPAFARSAKSFRWIKMPFWKYTPAAGAGD